MAWNVFGGHVRRFGRFGSSGCKLGGVIIFGGKGVSRIGWRMGDVLHHFIVIANKLFQATIMCLCSWKTRNWRFKHSMAMRSLC